MQPINSARHVLTVLPGMPEGTRYRLFSSSEAASHLNQLVGLLARAIPKATAGSPHEIGGLKIGALQASSMTDGTVAVEGARLFVGLREGRPGYTIEFGNDEPRLVSIHQLAAAVPPDELGKWLYLVTIHLASSPYVGDESSAIVAMAKRCLA